MSTKSTLAHGDDFHFYREAFDEDHVYLEMHDTEFEAGCGRVMVPIPIHIWETIRHLGGARLDLVDRTDEELLEMVEKDVDQRIAEYVAAEGERPERNGVVRLCGTLVLGNVELPREEQVSLGMKYFTEERRRQRSVRAAIVALRRRVPDWPAEGAL